MNAELIHVHQMPNVITRLVRFCVLVTMRFMEMERFVKVTKAVPYITHCTFTWYIGHKIFQDISPAKINTNTTDHAVELLTG